MSVDRGALQVSFIPPPNKPDIDVTAAVVALTSAMDRVEKTELARQAAYQEHQDAITNANKIQVDFDALVNHLRATAPKGTTWEIQYGPD